MIQDKGIWAEEKAYLDRVMREIDTQLDMGAHAADNYKSEAMKLQKSMWEDVRIAPSSLFDLEDAAQINQLQMDLKNKASLYRFSHEKVARLTRMRQSPYFGRIDFWETGEKAAEKIYIGIHHLNANDTMEILVYDWRAPVSGMFYDFEIGPSRYSCPAGVIEGQLLLKRQYRIENSDIVYMFDSSLNINDAMLQEILGRNTDSKMRTIVTSIQKEQNTVIRNDRDRILIVEGPAGSGKTSIALHRAAYLLYKYRDSIHSENILIFSPNHVFEDYVSHVLPELGEENIRRSTFADFFSDAFFENQQTETVNQQMEYILNTGGSDNIRLGCIQFKASPLFLAALKKYVLLIEDGNYLKFKDVAYHDTLLISAEEIHRLYRNQNSRFPYASRLEKIRQRLFSLLEEHEESRVRESADKKSPADKAAELTLKEEYQSLQNDIVQMTTVDIGSLYIGLLKDIGSFVPASDPGDAAKHRGDAACGIRELERGVINYEDLAPMVYLKAALETRSSAGAIQHVIIDEAQDYTPVQYEIFKTVFRNCSMTILGDINQTVNGYMNIGSFDTASDIFDAVGFNRIVLTKSYRSSRELADFCKGLLVSPVRAEQLDRHGVQPKLVRVRVDRLYREIADDIADLKSRGYPLIAVICKTAAQCRAVYQAVRSAMDIDLISNHNEVYSGGVVVIPSYLAKGLEFDAVLVHSVEDKDYHAPEDRKLLYTVCTRALHELHLYCSGTMSRFISGIDKKLYTVHDRTE